jgi:membrane protein implicated in regulation of membrane protease activity
MELFLHTSLSFPTVLLSFLLCVAILYWVVAALGLVDIDLLDGDAESALEGLAGLLLKCGLNGVPVTLVLTLLFFFAWLGCYFVQLLILDLLPLGLLRYPLGLLAAVAAVVAAVPLVALLIRPLRPLFRKLESTDSRSLLGQRVLVRSGRVTEQHGEAMLENGGAGLILRIRAEASRDFKRGDRVVLLEYLPEPHAYRVISEAEFDGLSVS